jgi:hypothetical protein
MRVSRLEPAWRTFVSDLRQFHTRLTFRHAGRDYRLTDVHGNVVKELFA